MDVREKLVEQAISHFWYGVSHDIFSEPVTTYAKLAIEALKKENGVTVQEWISVDDRLPEMGEHHQSEDVLVCIDYRPDDPGTTEDTYVSIDHVDFNCFGQGEFSCERDDPRGGEPSPYLVSHWAYLPQPPKGE